MNGPADIPKSEVGGEPKYTIGFSQELSADYRDGFADGYSRAWTECWDYMRSEISKMTVKETALEAAAKNTPSGNHD